ncbi:M28 family peptidase [Rhodocaloribacter litoris]|uniref:M28 family peptidase n=1 Tax=Rhodocaloribacter litoris TaxID=2558931 RepID=UPI001E3A04F2|nr:M28 family peptidase [Rhodocaloribacter litoris]
MQTRILTAGSLWAVLLMLITGTACAQDADDAPPATTNRTPTVFDAPAIVQRYQATITPEDLAAHLYLFASDFFEGRETTTRGQKLAAHYLAAQYRKMGLAPKGTVATDDPLAPEAYFQPFTVHGRRLKKAELAVKVGGATVATSTFAPPAYDADAFLSFGGAPEVSAGVVFAGYGIADDGLGYNDYAALEAQGIAYQDRWLLILRDEPLRDAETSRLPTEDGKPSAWTTGGSTKLRYLFRAGMPKGILIVGDVGPRAEKSVAGQAAEAAGRTSVGSLSLEPQGGGFRFPPVYIISSDLADRLLAPTGRTVAEVKAEIDAHLAPVVFAVEDVTVESRIEHEAFQAQTENVLAFIEGTDPLLKDEVVVLSSHYDHVGMTSGEGDTIYNGADDDGSGTVAILEIAEAFARARADGYGPRRSILFLNVSGEEKGLLGSAYYADEEPVLPLEKTVTNLNIDMIGRRDPTYPGNQPDNYVYIIGSNLISQELHDLNARVNEVTGLKLDLHERFNSKDDPNQFYRRSDHWNFGKHNIPFIFYFNGTHEDYHGLDDEPDKIDYPQLARRAQLIFATAWQVANQDKRPAVSGKGFN